MSKEKLLSGDQSNQGWINFPLQGTVGKPHLSSPSKSLTHNIIAESTIPPVTLDFAPYPESNPGDAFPPK